MFAASRILPVMALALGFASNAHADDKKPVKPAAEPGKPLVIQIDASKLPPDVLKQLLQLAEKPTGQPGKPGAKPAADPGKPGSKPDVKPGSKPDVKPGEKPGSKPNSQDEIIQRLDKLSTQIEQLRKSLQK